MQKQKLPRWSKQFMLIAIGALLLQMGTGIHSTVFTNFVSDELGIAADQLGLVSGIREIPGLLTIVLALATLFLTESVLAAACMGLVALGLYAFSLTQSFSGLILATTILSIGQHLYFPIQSAMVLKASQPHERASRLGSLSSVTAFATVTATLLVRGMAPFFSYRTMFQVAAGIAIVGALFQLSLKRGGKADLRRALVFRWKYKTYYVLNLLAGSRRHINQTFASFALVSLHNVDLASISLLFLASNILSIFSRPLLGKIIDRWGEGKSLTLNYTLVSLLFLGYAFLRNVKLLYLVFILDQLLLGFEVAITTHLDKICDPQDISASLAMGGTINHITAVLVPIIGGFLWAAISPAATFLAGLVLCLVSLVQAYRLPLIPCAPEQEIAG